ncbi:MAG TPA: excinuclease ABC subunit UvrC [Bacteroidales bacterium]|nr:excinuclease ABC subunit UvrC [Bacteroidales bacterium]HOK73980.1 excinuclease ABC subunit UvrC [Bacteroidales bacterium]HOM40851.1 excinuclease ABC subunit UvrC [Bacteroidales bacterium]HOU30515.1 excinuclease ABC subunit UvrC [Bacteroidales bacterium]HPP91803.1 excinuclease ABC subunit UvrC [Bacteroidales bacterium]
MTIDPKSILPVLPSKPGVYQFLDSSGRILYVGKARNLKKRISSYFSKRQPGKTAVMLSHAASLHHIVTETESDALLLENNLIKKHQPRYNILLKDDKTYPWICVKKEPFPRIFSTRKVIRDGSEYFGPYTSVQMVKTILDLVRQLYPLRTCNLSLTENNIKKGKFKACLEYHIGRCKAPCIGLQTAEDYSFSISQIRDIIKGNISEVINHLEALMKSYASELRFEDAQRVKEKIELLSRYRSKSVIVSTFIRNVDVFGYAEDNNRAYINYLRVHNGAVIQAFTLEIQSRLEEEKETLLGLGITEIKQKISSNAREAIVPFLPDFPEPGIKYTVPAAGEKRKLLELAVRNAMYYRQEQQKRREEREREKEKKSKLEKVKADLHLPLIPKHIECFDNSNLMGENPVAACVVFRNGIPSKSEYRHYNIKTVKGPDDYSSMEEIVYRRYSRMLDENQSLPDLVIIDGGKGQLNAALKSLEKLNLETKIPVIGIAKKLEEIYFPGDSLPFYLDKTSYTLRLIQQIRNEAHRFGLSFHRKKRSMQMIFSELDNIKGIGPKTKEILMKHFNSIDDIKSAPGQEIEKLIGKSKARILRNHFSANTRNET